jgi:CO/xanthine dehydrogenase FAD-binding subunit
MKTFEYLRPSSLEEACAMLSAPGGPVKALAGGTDLIVQMRAGSLQLETLVSLRDVPGLSFVRAEDDGGLTIGALTALGVIEHSPDVNERFPAIAQAAAWVGSVQVRSRATVGGNLCNAAPSADTAPILIALGAEAVLTDGRGERVVLLEEFFTGPGRSVLARGELLKEIHVPSAARHGFATYLKTFRSAMDCCTVGVGVWVDFAPGSTVVRDARLALGAVAPTPMRARASEALLVGRDLDETTIALVSAKAVEEAQPIDDIRSSADYRQVLVEVMTSRVLEAAREWAQNGGGR